MSGGRPWRRLQRRSRLPVPHFKRVKGRQLGAVVGHHALPVPVPHVRHRFHPRQDCGKVVHRLLGVSAQLDTLVEDIEIAGVKIGMLANRANASVVTEFLDKHKFAHVVLDPVFRPTAGNAELLDTSGLKFVRDELLKRVSVITPNVPEAEFLTGLEVKDLAGMKVAGLKLVEMGARAVVVTGGHLEKPIDVLCIGTEVETFGGDHVKSPNTHGSGCTFSSAIVAQLASGQQLREAVILAKAYVTKAIEKSYAIGKGAGPLNQLYRFHQEQPLRGVHEVPQHGMHPAAEPAAH